MKGLSMPTSSPSRAEGFPLPLMRFVSGGGGGGRCNSRGGRSSRSSPILYLNRLRRNADIALDPSSPKVTCIGRVRPAAANKRDRDSSLTGNPRSRRGWLVRHAMVRFYRQRKAMRRFFSKWFMFLRADYCKKVDANDSPLKIHSKEKNEKIESQSRGFQKYSSRNLCRENKSEMCLVEKNEDPFYHDKKFRNIGGEIRENKKDLTLTRCKSAPYRCSSLGGRLFSENDEESEGKNSRINRENGGKFGNSMKNGEDNVKGILGFSGHPLLLTRSKSEPARGKEG